MHFCRFFLPMHSISEARYCFFLTDRLLRGMSLERHNPQQLQLQVPIEHLSPELQTILWQLRLFLLQSDDRVNPFSLNKWLDCLV